MNPTIFVIAAGYAALPLLCGLPGLAAAAVHMGALCLFARRLKTAGANLSKVGNGAIIATPAQEKHP